MSKQPSGSQRAGSRGDAMTCAISMTQTSVVPSPSLPYALRRRLTTELGTLETAFLAHTIDDRMSKEIKSWLGKFCKALKGRVSEEIIHGSFTRELQDLLRDPMPTFHSPLEKESFLGSDGETYGQKALAVYLSCMSANNRSRSPFQPGQDKQFTVQPHTLVNACAEWLQSHKNLLPPHPEVERAYRELERLGSVPKMPTRERLFLQQRARLLIEQQAKRNADLAQETEQARATAAAQAVARTDQLFQGIVPTIQETTRLHQERREAIRRKETEVLASIAQERTLARGRVVELTRRNEVLFHALDELEGNVDQLTKDTHELKVSIAETQLAIAKRDEERANNAWAAVATIVAAVVITILAPELQAIPIPGGLMAGPVVPL